ncbi:hypothetical protein BOVA115_4249 [Bacteroides ovatus]|nr:hypothetical protein BOVA115_4249 [Bacteroides ovatus]
MYLCHSEILMPKDTKSLGNNKAPACESRGFVRKKQKVCILTHLHLLEDKGLERIRQRLNLLYGNRYRLFLTTESIWLELKGGEV